MTKDEISALNRDFSKTDCQVEKHGDHAILVTFPVSVACLSAADLDQCARSAHERQGEVLGQISAIPKPGLEYLDETHLIIRTDSIVMAALTISAVRSKLGV